MQPTPHLVTGQGMDMIALMMVAVMLVVLVMKMMVVMPMTARCC